jgi:thioredoxin-dependent peroxiredoxin
MKKLKTGQRAPGFNARDYLGKQVSLDDYKGKKVLLSFHVFASCPFCNLRVNETRNKQAEWSARGLEIIHVFPSPGESVGRFAGKNDPPFAVIADPAKSLFSQYGISKSLVGMFAGFLKVRRLFNAFKIVGLFTSLKNNDAPMHQLPADFIIDEKGILEHVYYAKTTSDNLPLDEIDNHLSNLTIGSIKPVLSLKFN